MNAFIAMLGATLVHFLWQGLLIGCATAVVLALLRNSREMARVVWLDAEGRQVNSTDDGVELSLSDLSLPSRQALEKALQNIHAILDGGVKLGKLAADVAEAAKARLTIHTSLAEGAPGASLLVETVSENLAVKKAVLAEAVPLLLDGALLATNTSALSVTVPGVTTRRA